MSTIKADAITASTGTNTNIAITGKGTGKLKLGDGELLFPDSDGSAGQYIKTDGSANLEFATLPTAGFTLGTVTSINSGSQVIVASDIPSGVKFIVLSWDNFSLNSTGYAEVRIGDSGGIETSGYDSNHEEAAFQSRNSTTGYAILTSSIAANDMNGQMILSLVDSSTNLWTATHQWRGDTSGGNIGWGAGIKALSGELTQIMMMGSNGFDGSGTANINYM